MHPCLLVEEIEKQQDSITLANLQDLADQTIEGTALDLNIRKTSVVTYRQRAYEKLGISRQTELVALVNNLRADGASSRISAPRHLAA